MNAVADHIATNNLVNDQATMTAYNNLANALYRTKDNNKSALCYVYYMQKRRSFVSNDFWQQVVGLANGNTSFIQSILGVNANGHINNKANETKAAIEAL